MKSCSWTTLSAAFIALLWMSGCGTCGQVTQHRADFVAKQESSPTNRDHHIIVDIPKSLVSKQAKTAFSSANTSQVKLRNMGDVGQYLDKVSITPRSLAIDFDMRNAAKIALDLDVGYGSHPAFGLQLDAVAPVEYDRKTRTLSLIIRYDIFERVTPRVSRGASEKLSHRLHGQLPAVARALISKKELNKYADKGIKHLVKHLYPSIREDILKPMGEITRFSFKMPDVPVERISLTSTQSNIRLGVRTTLPATGLTGKAPKLKKGEMRFAISADALAKLGNWAMAEGKIPDRYNRSGKAKASGEFVAGLGWQRGAAPMKVKLWTADATASPMCLFVQAGAVPKVSLKGKSLKVGFKDGRIEEVIGPPLIEEAMDLMGIGRRAFNFTKSIALKQTLRIGSKNMGVDIVRAGFSSDALRIHMKVGAKKTRKIRKTRSSKEQTKK